MTTPKYAAKAIAVDVQTEQLAKDAVQHYKLKAQKTGTGEVGGPVSMRDFFDQAALKYYHFLSKKDNGENPFEHCTRLPRGRVKRAAS